MPVTLQDIADDLGLQKSTVSRVLNGKQTRVKVSAKTQGRILDAVKRLGYHPNAAARSLALRKTGHIGFILSDKTTDGWANLLYAQTLDGVERACRIREYGLNINLYNLSNIKSFVFPERVGQRSVDGLILAGHVEEDVLRQFKEFNIPCVCIGDDLDIARAIPTVASDFIGGIYQATEYLAKLGHRKIVFSHITTNRGIETMQCVAAKVEESLTDRFNLEFTVLDNEGTFNGDFYDAPKLMSWWKSLPLEKRPTAIIATDQVQMGMLRLLNVEGLSCPKDISLISTSETRSCEFSFPSLTSIKQDLIRMGQEAVDLLLRQIDSDSPSDADISSNGLPCDLVIRESCRNLSESQTY